MTPGIALRTPWTAGVQSVTVSYNFGFESIRMHKQIFLNNKMFNLLLLDNETKLIKKILTEIKQVNDQQILYNKYQSEQYFQV